MSAVARIALSRGPIERIREDQRASRRGDDRAEPFKVVSDKQPDQPEVPTAEQLALAGLLPMPIASPTPTPPVEIQPMQLKLDASSIGELSNAKLAAIAEPAEKPGVKEETLTPLEQAVVDLIERAHTDGNGGFKLEAPAPKLVAPTVEVHEPRALPEPAQPTSHVHLVLDEGDRRVVMTVAVRGSDVNVALRAHDDGTAAALARNAASLDEAMRARGLDLAELSTGRDNDPSQRERDNQQPTRERQPRERFDLKELI